MAYREIRDGAGKVWTVWDTYLQAAHRVSMANLQGGWLTFEHDGERRRLVPAPVGWADEPEDILRKWLAISTPAKLRLEEHEAREAVRRADEAREESIPILKADSFEPDRPLQIPRVTEDARTLIERSRRTLEDVDRAIDAQSQPIGDPQYEPHRR